MLMVKMECDRELSAFILVAPVDLLLQPFSIRASQAFTSDTGCREMSETKWSKLNMLFSNKIRTL